jgi:hypothetical protein
MDKKAAKFHRNRATPKHLHTIFPSKLARVCSDGATIGSAPADRIYLAVRK